MVAFRLLTGFLLSWGLCAQVSFFPLKDVQPGMKGTGKTVFNGDKIEEFQVEVLGVLENIGPRQSLILARLSGGPIARTGVMQGMSGSPVYIDGKLVGAVAMAFPFSTEPIAGIRPISDMLDVRENASVPRPARAMITPWEQDLSKLLAAAGKPAAAAFGESRLVEIATPISFGGFTRRTIEQFTPQLRALGLEPRQGVSGGGTPPKQYGQASTLQPGSMISVQLLSGDMSIGADGTVTHIDGRDIYAFGHRFLSVGGTELPFARAEVLTLLPNLNTSFKISTAREWLGTITQDRNAAVTGILGKRAELAPLSITVTRHGSHRKTSSYRMRMANDRFLTPFLLQMAVFSAIDATERTVGLSSFAVRGQIDFQGGAAPVMLSNMFAGDFNVPQQVSLAAAVPLAYALQSGFESLKIKNISLTIDAFDEKKQFQIDEVWPSRTVVRPGETVDLTVGLSGENGAEIVRKVSYTVPVGASPGPLFFTVADGNTINVTDYRSAIGTQPKSAAQVVSFLNALRGNSSAYVRVWRPEPVYQVQGEDLPAPPPSLALILAKGQGNAAAAAVPRNAKVAEMEIQAGEVVVSGSKTVQVEVKE